MLGYKLRRLSARLLSASSMTTMSNPLPYPHILTLITEIRCDRWFIERLYERGGHLPQDCPAPPCTSGGTGMNSSGNGGIVLHDASGFHEGIGRL